jgi:hypothetical protein
MRALRRCWKRRHPAAINQVNGRRRGLAGRIPGMAALPRTFSANRKLCLLIATRKKKECF